MLKPNWYKVCVFDDDLLEADRNLEFSYVGFQMTFVLGFMQKLSDNGYCLVLTDKTARKRQKCFKVLCYSLHNGKVGSQH